MKNFDEIRSAARKFTGGRVAVPMGHDPSSVKALIRAAEEGIASSVIVAPLRLINETLTVIEKSLPPEIEVIDVDSQEDAAIEAVKIISSGQATILMKGLLKTSLFQKAILDKEIGLRTDRILSHVAVLSIPGQERLIAISDGGMNIRPGKQEFKQIVLNAADVMKVCGIPSPGIALLAAIEVPNEKMPETVIFAEIAEEGISGLKIAGPLALDCALDSEAASVKGITGPVAGKADILISPDIASGNILAKGLMYLANADIGGVIAGATAPIVMLSRSDTGNTKLNSLALGVIMGGENA